MEQPVNQTRGRSLLNDHATVVVVHYPRVMQAATLPCTSGFLRPRGASATIFPDLHAMDTRQAFTVCSSRSANPKVRIYGSRKFLKINDLSYCLSPSNGLFGYWRYSLVHLLVSHSRPVVREQKCFTVHDLKGNVKEGGSKPAVSALPVFPKV